jgi:hypothetical protein
MPGPVAFVLLPAQQVPDRAPGQFHQGRRRRGARIQPGILCSHSARIRNQVLSNLIMVGPGDHAGIVETVADPAACADARHDNRPAAGCPGVLAPAVRPQASRPGSAGESEGNNARNPRGPVGSRFRTTVLIQGSGGSARLVIARSCRGGGSGMGGRPAHVPCSTPPRLQLQVAGAGSPRMGPSAAVWSGSLSPLVQASTGSHPRTRAAQFTALGEADHTELADAAPRGKSPCRN